MAAIRLGGQTYELLGTRIKVLTDHPELANQIHEIFGRFRADSSSRLPDYTLQATQNPKRPNYFDLDRHGPGGWVNLRADAHFDRIVMTVITDFNSRVIRSLNVHGVHAGAVSLDGRVIAFPAKSGSGKSTLVAACAQVGFEYVSDEALCLKWETGQVIPYPKPVWISHWSREAVQIADEYVAFESPRYREAIVLPKDQGWTVASGDLLLTDVVTFEISGGTPELSAAPSSQVADALVRHAFRKRTPRRVFEFAAAQSRRSRAWKLRLGDPMRAARMLFDEMRRLPPE